MTTTSKTIAVVGPKELIDFPALGLFGVPAKVDTGADSSAIWATDIHEEEGKLYFTLFDRTSPFYTGQVMSAKKYSVSAIRNSFGQTEFRYKTTLKVVIAGRTINVRFTLANRENNRLPILIGRRTLHGKFLVDVARAEAQKPARLLLVSSQKTEKIYEFIKSIKAKSKRDLQVTYISYDDVVFKFGPDTTKIVIAETDEDIASYDIVHFKTWKEREVTAAMARYLQKRGVPFFDKRAVDFPANGKLYQYVALTDCDIPVPPSVFVMPDRYTESFELFKRELGLPFVFKGTQASRGAHNYLVKDKKSYDEAVRSMIANNIVAIAQKFIANTGDYRILVLGGHVEPIIFRSRQGAETHLNNTSQGGTASLVPVEKLPTEIRTDSVTATKVLELGIAGVDMMQDSKTGKWYCLEVNGDPQIASGAFQAEKVQAYIRYIESELSK